MVTVQKPQIIDPGKVLVQACSIVPVLSHMVPKLKKVKVLFSKQGDMFVAKQGLTQVINVQYIHECVIKVDCMEVLLYLHYA